MSGRIEIDNNDRGIDYNRGREANSDGLVSSITAADIVEALHDCELLFIGQDIAVREFNSTPSATEEISYDEIVELGTHKILILEEEEISILNRNKTKISVFRAYLELYFKQEDYSSSCFQIFRRE